MNRKNEKEEKIIEAAREIFIRYGYRRATMGEIAQAVKMSRPAVYLVFPSKEEILTAVIFETCQELLDEIRQGLPTFETEKEKLVFAFEIWSVRPFQMVQMSPDAKDLLESSYEFAGQVTREAFAEFETIIAEILKPIISSQSTVNISAEQIARLMTGAIYGFKNSATNVEELRQLYNDLITIILVSLESQKSKSKKSK